MSSVFIVRLLLPREQLSKTKHGDYGLPIYITR